MDENTLMEQAAHTAEYYFMRAKEWADDHNRGESKDNMITMINTYVMASALDFLATSHIMRMDHLINAINDIAEQGRKL